MSVAKRPADLLSGQRTLELISLVGDQSGVRRWDLLVDDFAALRPTSRSRAKNTISLLHELGIIHLENDDIRLSHAWRSLADEWPQRIAELVALTVVQIVGRSRVGCLRVSQSNGRLLIDSMLLPTEIGGLALWVIEFGVATRPHVTSRHWQIGSDYEHLFLTGARDANAAQVAPSLNLDSLQKKLLRDSENGAAAEEWALHFERNRLRNHPLVDQVARVSNDQVDAGYDIVSFSSELVLQYDLFIEVKSYVGHQRFFWSRNEIAKAKALGEKYCLYLVDRARMTQSEYHPHIISGPHPVFFPSSEAWDVSPTVFECVAMGVD